MTPPPPIGLPQRPSGQARRRVLEGVRTIPAGYVVTFDVLAAHAGVTPVEASTFITRLGDDERQMLPWHRVVAKGGAIGRGPWRERQFALLVREGVPVSPAGIVQEMAQRAIPDLASAQHAPAPAQAPPLGANRSRGMRDRP